MGVPIISKYLGRMLLPIGLRIQLFEVDLYRVSIPSEGSFVESLRVITSVPAGMGVYSRPLDSPKPCGHGRVLIWTVDCHMRIQPKWLDPPQDLAPSFVDTLTSLTGSFPRFQRSVLVLCVDTITPFRDRPDPRATRSILHRHANRLHLEPAACPQHRSQPLLRSSCRFSGMSTPSV